MKISRYRSAFLVLFSATAISVSSGVSTAAAVDPFEISFSGETSLTVEYGEDWSFALESSSPKCYSYTTGEAQPDATISNAPAGYVPTVYIHGDGNRGVGAVERGYENDQVLGVGNYVITVTCGYSYFGPEYQGVTDPSASLTITKAALGIETRVVPDPSNELAAIVTARLTGIFVATYGSNNFGVVSPEGVWTLRVIDEVGEIAAERTAERVGGDGVLSTSFYWQDATPGQQYTVTADFVPTGASNDLFAVTAAPVFNYTAPDIQRPIPQSSADASPPVAQSSDAAFGLPLWIIILAGAVILALATVVTIAGIRLNRRPRLATKDVSA